MGKIPGQPRTDPPMRHAGFTFYPSATHRFALRIYQDSNDDLGQEEKEQEGEVLAGHREQERS